MNGIPVQMAEPKADTKVDIVVVSIEFDYLVIDTGYTSRTISHFLDKGCVFALRPNGGGAEIELRRRTEAEKRSDPEGKIPIPSDKYDREYDGEPYYMESDGEGGEVERVDFPLFVSDHLGGDGLYVRAGTSSNDTLRQKADIVLGILHAMTPHKDVSLAEASYGTIAFECKTPAHALRIANNIRDLNYCAFFKMMDSMKIVEDKSSKTRVLIIGFDTESG